MLSVCCMAPSFAVCMAPSFAVLPGVLMYVSYMEELTVLIVFPTVAMRMYRSPLVRTGQIEKYLKTKMAIQKLRPLHNNSNKF